MRSINEEDSISPSQRPIQVKAKISFWIKLALKTQARPRKNAADDVYSSRMVELWSKVRWNKWKDQRVEDSNSFERVLGESSRERLGDKTSILDLNSPLVLRNSFLFCDWISLLTLECFSTSFPSALVLSISSSHLPDYTLFSRALSSTSCFCLSCSRAVSIFSVLTFIQASCYFFSISRTNFWTFCAST